MNYVLKYDQTKKIQKYGVDLSVFSTQSGSGVVYEETKSGHFEEWYSDLSTYHWFIIDGYGTFVIDDEHVEVAANDLVVVPPHKRIHYFGTLKMVLITTPTFQGESEHHVRMVEPQESPYYTSTEEKT